MLAATIPLYYLGFHFLARGTYATFKSIVVWLIWVPVWLALAVELWHGRRLGDAGGERAHA